MRMQSIIRMPFLLLWLGLAGCESYLPQKLNYIPLAWRDKVDVLEPIDVYVSNTENPLYLAVREPGAGGLTDAVLLRPLQNMTIYRVWNGPDGPYLDDFNTTNRYGYWWTSERPQGKLNDFRLQNAICPEDNELQWVTACTLHGGSLIAVGPTQSAVCKNGELLPGGPTLQIYVGNYMRDVECMKTYVKPCGEPDKTDYKAYPGELIKEDCP